MISIPVLGLIREKFMSYSLMKKNVVMIAVMFAAMVAFSQTGYAQAQAEAQPEAADNAAAAQDNQAPEQNDDLFGLDEDSENAPAAAEQKSDDNAAPAEDSGNASPR